jgi:hypothetical protein
MTWLPLSLGGLFLCLGSHPFTPYPLSVCAIRRWRRRISVSPAAISRDALCFRADDEEKVIRDEIDNCLELRRATSGLEVFAYVDTATDRTAERLSVYHEDITVRVSSRRCGKTHGMN